MAYTKTDWQTALITADNFNKLQTQYSEAVADAIGIRANGTAELRAEVVSDFPAHSIGRIVYHSGKKMFFYSNGVDWLLDPKEAYWGDAVNGMFSSTGNTTFSNSLGTTVIRNYRNFTLNPGHTITTQTGCRALVIRSWGDITINGIIDLDRKGGFGDRYINIGGVQYDLLGGLGGDGGGDSAGVGGKEDSGLRSAGGMRGGGGGGGSSGGAGGAKNTPFDVASSSNASGERKSSFGDFPAVDGANGGGGGGGSIAIGMSGTYSVEGGNGRGQTNGNAGGGGGGIQVRFSTGFFEADGGERPPAGVHGGGTLVLLAMGNITINGQIRCRGGNGGKGGNAYTASGWQAGGGGGGGGSGGGKAVAIRRGTYNNAGTVLLTGGAGGNGGTGYLAPDGESGTTGATGTISTYQL